MTVSTIHIVIGLGLLHELPSPPSVMVRWWCPSNYKRMLFKCTRNGTRIQQTMRYTMRNQSNPSESVARSPSKCAHCVRTHAVHSGCIHIHTFLHTNTHTHTHKVHASHHDSDKTVINPRCGCGEYCARQPHSPHPEREISLKKQHSVFRIIKRASFRLYSKQGLVMYGVDIKSNISYCRRNHNTNKVKPMNHQSF